jgi:MoxR-vWA-beta-propeller ternary system domain bpX4
MSKYFYDTICQLRLQEELILYNRLVDFKLEEEFLVREFLQTEYESENINYPFCAPQYNDGAALWGAKFVYTVSQLILYRKNKTEELTQILPQYDGEINASSILSADLCLRFLPQLLQDTKYIDPDDVLISLVENVLSHWPFSSIGYKMDMEKVDLAIILENACLQQMYVDRVISKKDLYTASLPVVNEKIKETLGIYAQEFWREFKIMS